MSYELRDHTADVAVAADGDTLGETFAAVADGLTAAMCETVPDDGERFELTVTAESREALLFDFLDELIFQRDVRSVLPADHEASVESDGDKWTVTASARGVPFSSVHAREIKAVTYSEMDLSRTGDGWEAYVVFDV
ncbi:archease [Halostella pelagica]|uniref:archease n=1 Tax=Halostella pelagica TaxID=2583824 RepID=UPI001080E75A|nr:archease [Halostella pelagica]